MQTVTVSLVGSLLGAHGKKTVQFEGVSFLLITPVSCLLTGDEAGINPMDGLLMGFEIVVRGEGVPAEDALVAALSCVPHLMLCAVLGQGKDLVAVMARIFAAPGVHIRVTLQAGEGHVGALAHRAEVDDIAVYHLHKMVLITRQHLCACCIITLDTRQEASCFLPWPCLADVCLSHNHSPLHSHLALLQRLLLWLYSERRRAKAIRGQAWHPAGGLVGLQSLAVDEDLATVTAAKGAAATMQPHVDREGGG